MLKKVAKKKVQVKKKVKKSSQAKVKKKVKAKEVVKVKKKRGRPPKPKTEETPKVPKKRGRPAGQKNKTFKAKLSTECYDEDYVQPTTYKFLGYCKCDAMIGSMDLVAKTIYVCGMCKNRAKTSTLKQELIIDKPIGKSYSNSINDNSEEW